MDYENRKNIECLFTENKESDEKIRKIISDILLIDSDEIREILDANNVLMQDIDAWFEKQGQTFTKKDVEIAYLKGVDDTKHELDKQCEKKPVEWREDDERIRRVFRGWIYTRPDSFFDGISKEKMLAWLEKQGEQKQEDEDIPNQVIDWEDDIDEIEETTDQIVEWEDEDDTMLNQIIEDVEKLAGPYVCYYKDVNWLKSLRDRIQGKTK